VVSLIGVIPHWQQGNINFPTAVLFYPTAMLGTYLSARIASLPIISPQLQLFALKSVMIVAALLIISFKSVTGFAGYLGNVSVDLNSIILLTVAASAGTITGAYITKFTQPKHLEIGFGFLILAVAIYSYKRIYPEDDFMAVEPLIPK
jgi:uncharacterized membrane protein YfcA